MIISLFLCIVSIESRIFGIGLIILDYLGAGEIVDLNCFKLEPSRFKLLD